MTAGDDGIRPDGGESKGVRPCVICGRPIDLPRRGRGAAGKRLAKTCPGACRRERDRRRKETARAPGLVDRLRARAARLRAEADRLEARAAAEEARPRPS